MSDKEIIDDIKKRFGGSIGIRRIRREYGVGYGRARRILGILNGTRKAEDADPQYSKDSIEVSPLADGAVAVTGRGQQIRTLDELLDAAGVDRTRWTVRRYSVNSWSGPSRGGQAQYFQVKAELVPSPASAINDVLSRVNIEPVSIPYRDGIGDLLFVLSPSDVHFGKYAWGEETGGSNYDVKIAQQLYRQAVSELIWMGERLGGIARTAIIVGNDLVHSDLRDMTHSGTLLDVDGRWQIAFRAALDSTIEAIDRLAGIAPVDVIIQPGNHDKEKSQVLGIALEMRYANTDQVTIINTPLDRRYYKYGKVLLGITHGDGVRMSELPGLMSKEARELWGDALYTEWLIGHFHRKRDVVFEESGVRIRVLPSLSPPDAWHSKHGWTSSVRAAEALLYHPDRGFVANLSSTV